VRDSKLLSPDDRLRLPYSAEELEGLGSEGVLKEYLCHGRTASSADRRGLYVINVELGDDCARKVRGRKEEVHDVEGEELWRSG
jgi:hypothetical protein